MNKKRDFFKHFLDSKQAWEHIQGPVYNRVIWDAAGQTITEMIDRTAPPAPGTQALDVGSGPGYATMYAARKFPESAIVGVDYSPAQVEWARRELEKDPLPNCRFEQGNAMDLHFDDGTFDMVLSIASIKHWPDPVQGLREIHRVLRPGGVAHVGEAARDCDSHDFDVFARAFTKQWWVNRSFVRWFLRTTVFGQSLTGQEAARMARDAGFSDVEVENLPGKPFFRIILTKDS